MTDDTAAAAAPIPRDETAFSLTTSGAPAAPLAKIEAATQAMRELEAGKIDEAGYNAAVAEPSEDAPPEDVHETEVEAHEAETGGTADAAPGSGETRGPDAEPA